jgi:hypothetical protein
MMSAQEMLRTPRSGELDIALNYILPKDFEGLSVEELFTVHQQPQS